MKKILAICIMALAMSLNASATSTCPVVRFLKHPALLTHVYQGGKLVVKGTKVVGKDAYKATKATGKAIEFGTMRLLF